MEVSARNWHKDHTILIDGEPGEERELNALGGYSRRIIFVRDLVIKITFHGIGSPIWDQSGNELKIWRSLRTEDRHHFAEVVEGGIVPVVGWSWVAQRFLKFDEDLRPVPDEIFNLIDSLKVRYSLRDLSGNLCGRNWGMVNGIPVIYDYGSVDHD